MWKKFEIYSILKNSFGQKKPCVIGNFVPRGVFGNTGGGVLNGIKIINNQDTFQKHMEILSTTKSEYLHIIIMGLDAPWA